MVIFTFVITAPFQIKFLFYYSRIFHKPIAVKNEDKTQFSTPAPNHYKVSLSYQFPSLTKGSLKAKVTRCNLSDGFFCADARPLCEFERMSHENGRVMNQQNSIE